MTELEVQLTANTKDLEAQLKKVEKAVSKFGDRIDKEGEKASKGFVKTGRGAANALPSVQEFSRVIQDAPFGIQGVGNNLQQLTANFGNLSRSAGGTIPALRAMLGALSGPAGILLAVSAITSLLTVFADKLKIVGGLSSQLAKATAEYVASAQSEVTVLENLVSVASDENQSKKVRLGAIERINEKYSKYLGNLDLESVKTDGVKSSVDALTKSMLKQAQVRGVQALIEEKFKDSSEDLVGLQLKQKDAAKAVASEVERLRSSVAAFNNVSKDLPLTDQIREIQQVVNNAGGSGSGGIRLLRSLVSEYNGAVGETRKFKSELDTELKPIQELLNSLTIDDLFNEFNVGDNGVTVIGEKIKTGVDKIKNDFLNLRDIFALNSSTQKTLDSFRPDFSSFKTSFNKLGDIVEFSLKDSLKITKILLDKKQEALREFNENASQIITTGTVNAFASIGEAIGSSLVNGTNLFQSIGGTLLKVIGQVATELGNAAIAIGVGMLAIKASFSNPFTAIAAGVALVALGSALGGIANSAVQGNTGSGAVAGQGSSGTRSSNFSSGGGGVASSGFGKVVFEISGQKLLGVLQNTQQSNIKLGGG